MDSLKQCLFFNSTKMVLINCNYNFPNTNCLKIVHNTIENIRTKYNKACLHVSDIYSLRNILSAYLENKSLQMYSDNCLCYVDLRNWVLFSKLPQIIKKIVKFDRFSRANFLKQIFDSCFSNVIIIIYIWTYIQI